MYYYSEPILDEKLKLNDIENDPFYQEYDEENEYETNKDFFLISFENGQEIFDYIEENKNPSILDELKQTNILKLAFENKLHIYKRFEYFGSGGFKLSGTLEDELSLEDILDKFIMPYESPESFDLQDDGEEEQNEKRLRVIDVLIRLLGKKELSSDEIKLIVDDNELCSKEEAQKRFTIQKLSKEELKDKLFALINVNHVENLGVNKLDEVYETYCRDKSIFKDVLDNIIIRAYEDTDPDILACVPALNQKEYARGTQLLCASYILAESSPKEDLDYIWKFYEENIFKSFYREILNLNAVPDAYKDEQKSKIKSLIETIQDYVQTNATLKEEGFFKKVFSSFSEKENKSNIVSKVNALEAATELLVDRGDNEGGIKRTSLFVSDDIPMILSSMLYAGKYANDVFRKKLILTFELILELFPTKTLLVCFYDLAYNADFLNETNKDEIEYYGKYLKATGFNKEYIFLAKLIICQKINEHNYELEEFEEENGSKKLYLELLKEYKENKYEIINYLDEENKLKFLSFVN